MRLKDLCWPHRRTGVEPGQRLTFDPSCPKCWLLQECGGRSGLESRPGEMTNRRRRGEMAPEAFAAMVRMQTEARAKARVERPDARSVR